MAALQYKENSVVYTVDINPVESQSANHICIQKDARLLISDDVDNKPLDLVFFDCHEFDVHVHMFIRLKDAGIITDKTVLALHDTNLHYAQYAGFSYQKES